MLPQEGAGCEKGQSLHKLTDEQTNSIMAWKRPKTKKEAEGQWTMVSQHAVGEIGRIITQLKITLARTPLTPRPTVSPSSGKPCLHQARRLLANSSSSTTPAQWIMFSRINTYKQTKTELNFRKTLIILYCTFCTTIHLYSLIRLP